MPLNSKLQYLKNNSNDKIPFYYKKKDAIFPKVLNTLPFISMEPSDIISIDGIIGLLVLPLSPQTTFSKDEIELHKEVQFCLWAMNISLSVYLKLLSMVDIKIRKDISDVVSKFLAEWKGAEGLLSDALDVLIISEFTKRNLTDIPDMENLQRNQNCQMLSSTVACYIKDIAIQLDAMHHGDLDSAIGITFPPSGHFIGRCFFPRLAAVASRLLELTKSDSDLSRDSTLDFN
jgi:hypothetical protein